MSELEKAKQIAAEAFNFKSKAYTTIEQQNEIIKVNRKAFMQILSLPSLTIPKSIADELDGFNPNEGETKIAVLIEGYNECFISDELMQFCLVDNNLNLCALYLAGKALGVDLVKVVADE